MQVAVNAMKEIKQRKSWRMRGSRTVRISLSEEVRDIYTEIRGARQRWVWGRKL